MWAKASIFIVFLLFRSSSCVEFIYNSNFTTTNILLVGAIVTSSPSIITNQNPASIGRALYPSRISAASSALPLPFATSFIFSLAPNVAGFAFVFLPSLETPGVLYGLYPLGVYFEVFNYDDGKNVSVYVNSSLLQPLASAVTGFYGGRNEERFKELRLNNSDNYQAWIEFNRSVINVTIARAGSRKPIRPLISTSLNLTGDFLDQMFVGFVGLKGNPVQSHRILSWSYSNSNFSIGDALVTRNLPSFKLPGYSVFKSIGFIVGVSVGAFVLLVCVIGLLSFYVLRRQRQALDKDVEDWETEYWPHRVQYRIILKATNGFSKENMIGYGGNSKVYRGVLDGKEVAVKRIMINPRESVVGTSEFLAEVSSLGRLRHKNIVGLRGWCKKGGESLILVYEYMENGSVDKRIFDCNEMLNWEERRRVIGDVASGMLYLHDGWESKVLHRDIKSSNVLLDKDMNARVGDFGLAKLQSTSKEVVSTTNVVGTVGYMAPELVRTGRASVQTDVYSFGVLVLEVVSGRRPTQEGKEGIVEWIWGLMEKNKVVDGLDERLKAEGKFEREEVEMALRLGLLCVHPDPRVRPKMRQVVQILEQGRLNDDDDDGEREREDMEVSLLERLKRPYLLGIGEGRQQHPTFQDMWNSTSYSISFDSFDSIFQGR